MSRAAAAFLGSVLIAGCAAVFGIPDDVDRAADDGGIVVGVDRNVSDAPVTPADVTVPPGPCEPTAPFNAPAPLAGITTAEAEASPRLSDDERTIYFDAVRADETKNTTHDLFVATRSAITAPFDTPRRLGSGVNTAASDEYGPAISADQRTLVFERNTAGGTSQFFIAQRPPAIVDFPTAVLIHDERPQPEAVNPFLRGEAKDLWFGAKSGGVFVLVDARSAGDGGYDTDVGQLTSADFPIDFPALSADGLTVYYASSDGDSGGIATDGTNLDIFRARRDATSDAFNRGVRVPELSTPGTLDAAGWISPDNCRLYFSRTSSTGQQDIFVASR